MESLRAAALLAGLLAAPLAAAAQGAAVPAGVPALGAGAAETAADLVRFPTFRAAGIVESRNRVIPLAGVAATSPDLRCGAGADLWPCGRVARTALQRFVRGRTLECRAADGATGAARCAVAGADIGEWLVAQGWAAAQGPAYAAAETAARQAARGIWGAVRSGPYQTYVAGAELGMADAVLKAEVELSTQSMTVTYRGEVIGEWPVSTAREGKETPTGTWAAQWLSRDHRSRLYDGAPMPYSIFFEGDYAIHGTYQASRLGEPASHGCVRLSVANAKRLFNLAAKEGLDNTLIVIRP